MSQQYIYIIEAELLNAIKVGSWNSTPKSLFGRYQTYYGNHIKIFLFNLPEGENLRKVELKLHQRLCSYKTPLSSSRNELYRKQFLNNYINICKDVCNCEMTIYKKANKKIKQIHNAVYKNVLIAKFLEMFNIPSLTTLDSVTLSRPQINEVLSKNFDTLRNIALSFPNEQIKLRTKCGKWYNNDSIKQLLLFYKFLFPRYGYTFTITQRIRKRVNKQLTDCSIWSFTKL